MRATIPIFAGILFAAASLVHCGSPAHAEQSKATCSCDAPVVKSGSRLKARVLKSDDGAQQFVGWYDSVLKAPCTSGGDTGVCMPDVAVRWFNGGSGFPVPYFADASCTVPAVVILATDGEYGTTPVLCESADNVIRRVGSTLTTVYLNAGGGCAPAHDDSTDRPGTVLVRCDGVGVTDADFASFTATMD